MWSCHVTLHRIELGSLYERLVLHVEGGVGRKGLSDSPTMLSSACDTSNPISQEHAVGPCGCSQNSVLVSLREACFACWSWGRLET